MRHGRKAMRRFDAFQRTTALRVGMDRQECLSYLNASGQVAWRCFACTTWAERSTRRRDDISESVSSPGPTGLRRSARVSEESLRKRACFRRLNIFILLRFQPPETPHSAKEFVSFRYLAVGAGSPLPV